MKCVREENHAQRKEREKEGEKSFVYIGFGMFYNRCNLSAATGCGEAKKRKPFGAERVNYGNVVELAGKECPAQYGGAGGNAGEKPGRD